MMRRFTKWACLSGAACFAFTLLIDGLAALLPRSGHPPTGVAIILIANAPGFGLFQAYGLDSSGPRLDWHGTNTIRYVFSAFVNGLIGAMIGGVAGLMRNVWSRSDEL